MTAPASREGKNTKPPDCNGNWSHVKPLDMC